MVLDRCNGNKRRACRMLDISYHTLQAHLDMVSPNPSMKAQAAGELIAQDSVA